jgi:hypothetical protein
VFTWSVYNSARMSKLVPRSSSAIRVAGAWEVSNPYLKHVQDRKVINRSIGSSSNRSVDRRIILSVGYFSLPVFHSFPCS